MKTLSKWKKETKKTKTKQKNKNKKEKENTPPQKNKQTKNKQTKNKTKQPTTSFLAKNSNILKGISINVFLIYSTFNLD